ncbi:hypothetical protein HDU97_003294 [Phlyctochytrium planicorne]|nr:hypothetical protein HDU97_003294 [Phlyctochytrium planicorne]
MEKSIARLSTAAALGLYAGMSVYDSFVIQPLYSRHVVDGQKLFKALATPSSQLQGAAAAAFTLAGAVSGMLTGDVEWYFPAISGVALWAWSAVFTNPVKDRLVNVQADVEPATANALIRDFGNKQWVRTIVGTATFGCTLYKLIISRT